MASTPRIRRNSQELRKNMTKEERHLWYDFLKAYPLPVHRQYPFASYIVDFYCHKARLVIELDGSQHCTPEGLVYDEKRTQYLQSLGLSVLRISNSDVMREFPSVCEKIDAVIRSRITSLRSLCCENPRHPSSVTASPCHLPPGGRLSHRQYIA